MIIPHLKPHYLTKVDCSALQQTYSSQSGTKSFSNNECLPEYIQSLFI